MCELCLTAANSVESSNPYFKDLPFLPGYNLVKATNDEGMAMKKGDYGLTRQNDPDFIFNVVPVSYATEDKESFFDAAGQLETQILSSATSLDAISALANASKEAGWNNELPLAAWLCHRLAAYLNP